MCFSLLKKKYKVFHCFHPLTQESLDIFPARWSKPLSKKLVKAVQAKLSEATEEQKHRVLKIEKLF